MGLFDGAYFDILDRQGWFTLLTVAFLYRYGDDGLALVAGVPGWYVAFSLECFGCLDWWIMGFILTFVGGFGFLLFGLICCGLVWILLVIGCLLVGLVGWLFCALVVWFGTGGGVACCEFVFGFGFRVGTLLAFC